jgi:hypothetical protein
MKDASIFGNYYNSKDGETSYKIKPYLGKESDFVKVNDL